MKPRVISEDDFKVLLSNRERARGGGPTAPKKARPSTVGIGRRCVGENQAPSPSKYDSKWEANFASKLELEKKAGVIRDYQHHGMTLMLCKGQYHRIDFLIWHLDKSIEIAQVKGWHKNMRAGIKGLKWAASLHPWFTWTLHRWTGQGWESRPVEV